MGQLDGKVAIVTGASRGIGRGIALELAKRGATIVVNYNQNADAANEVVHTIEAGGGKGLAVKANVAVMEDATALVKAAVEAFEKVDILVNNAGTTRDNLIMRMKEEDWDEVLDTNLKSAWNMCKLVSSGAGRTNQLQRQ